MSSTESMMSYRQDSNPAKGSSTCIILLSDKSSGSTALQSLLATDERVRLAPFTRHQENETLYWVKAAAVLGLPQPRLTNSVIPMAPDRAREELLEFLERNLGHSVTPDSAGDWLFDGWLNLCHELGPFFLEKSPHHLHASSALELMLRCADRSQHVNFRFIGLARNPMDTLYSKWRRWRHVPEVCQYEWLRAYGNLQEFRENAGSRLLTLHYEDLVQEPRVLGAIWSHCGLTKNQDITQEVRLHQNSLGRWKTDKTFGFQLAPEVERFALGMGYENWNLRGRRTKTWPIRRIVQSNIRQARTRGGAIKSVLLKCMS